jgi:hypothetical protein
MRREWVPERGLNLKTAKAIDLTIPLAILARDRQGD